MNSNSSTPHGRGVRGFNFPRSSLLFEGGFGRIFRALPPAEFGNNDEETKTNLSRLAAAMVGPPDNPKDGPDSEESGIPALYTYLGQFVDHDLTFDPASSLQQQNDLDGLVDYRTPRFDLDSVYGRGPEDQPYLYFRDGSGAAAKLLLGSALTGGTATTPPAADLPRNNAFPARAIIGDPRNDENVIIGQLQSLFYRFHNRFVDEHPEWSFPKVQREVRFHYQWMLINDFLPKLIDHHVYHKVFPHYQKGKSIADFEPQLKFYHARNEAFIPFEFSVAAYRFGHSMIRPGYRLNDNNNTLLPIFGGEGGAAGRPQSLRGFMPPESDWGIDWARFIDIEDRPNGVHLDDEGNIRATGRKPSRQQLDDNKRRLQLAYRIDTSLVKPLSDLPPDVADRIIKSLAERNLVRGWRLRLPSGQNVARAMGEKPLEKIWIGRFEDRLSSDVFDLNDPKREGFDAFCDNCPLWVYILAETFNHVSEGKSRVLGPVGGTIVAETFAGLLKYDSHSFLNQEPRWKPIIGSNHFGLKEFVKYALGM